MQIDILAGNTFKITLLKSDMNLFNVSYEEISGKGHDTKLALSRLIASIGEEYALSLSGERLLVEAFPSDNGGCILYISCLGTGRYKTDKNLTTLICDCSCLKDMIGLCYALYEKHGTVSSKLYYYSFTGIYRLVIASTFIGEAIRAVVSEFATVKPVSVLSETEEFFSLISTNAIKDIHLLK